MSSKAQKKITGMAKPELNVRLAAAEAELFKARMNHATGQLGNTASLWSLRKEVARIKTALSAGNGAGGTSAGGKR